MIKERRVYEMGKSCGAFIYYPSNSSLDDRYKHNTSVETYYAVSKIIQVVPGSIALSSYGVTS